MSEFTIICSSFKLQSNQLTFFENISSASCLYLYNSFSAASLTFCSISLMLTSWSSLEPVLTFCSKLIIAVLAAAIRSYRTPNNSQRETIMFKIGINMFEFSFCIKKGYKMLLIAFLQNHFNASSLIHTCKYLCISSQYYIYKQPAMNNYL